jgi:hypothetical protein
MKSRKNVMRVGAALLALALLIFGSAHIYLLLAPKTYAATAKVRLTRSSNGAPVTLKELPLQMFKDDRNLTITGLGNSSVFELRAFAATPEKALAHANLRLHELMKNASSVLNSRCEVIESAVAIPRAVRPRRSSVLGISSLVAGNLAVAGLGCIAFSLAMGRLGLEARKNLAVANP